MKTAVVLSGGGAKGSYQLGVWKALRKLHIKYDIVTGTSIGALNGVLMTENSYFKAKRIWKTINLEYLFNELPKTNKNIDILKFFSENFIKNGGMDISKIEKVLKDNINIKKFYQSNINYGLITFNFTTKKPLILEKKDIPKEKIVDYLMASATCYPAFKMKEIDGNKYIDGGYYDNLPIELALNLGADNLIIVDLGAIGLKRKPSKKVKSIIIKPKNNISFFLNFDEESAKINMKFGYNDTMKAFNKLDGNIFTFKKDNINNYYIDNIDRLNSKNKKEFLKNLEKLGKIFKLDESKIYTIKNFINCLQEEVNKSKKVSKKDIKKKINSKTLILFFLNNLESKKQTKKLSKIFNKEYLLAKNLKSLGVSYEE